MKKLLSSLLAVLTLFAVVPCAMGATPNFQVNTLSGGSLTTGLVSYWNMQGNSNDYYGSNNGTDTSVSYGTSYGKVSQGADFGTDISFSGSGVVMNVSTGFSVSMWQYVAAYSSTNVNMFSKCNSNISNPIDWSMHFTSSSLWHTTLGLGNGSNYSTNADYDFSGTFPFGWYFFVATVTSGKVVNVYVNNVNVASYTANNSVFADSTNTAHLGRRNDGGNPFTGYKDEVGFWNKVLSTNEISDLYNGGAGQTMCNGTGGPVCAGGAKHKIILISFEAKPEHFQFA